MTVDPPDPLASPQPGPAFRRGVDELAELLAGTVREHTHDGIRLFADSGAGAIEVRIRQDRPLIRLRDRVSEFLLESRRLFQAAATLQPLQRFTTFEGEHAGVITITMPPASGLEVTIGLVAADDTCELIEATAKHPSTFERARRLVRLLAELSFLGKGELRRRRYLYTPPAGWHVLPHPQPIEWLHPRYPSLRARLLVFDAIPIAVSASDEANRMVTVQNRNLELVVDSLRPATQARIAGHLSRYSVSQPGPEFEVDEAILQDSRFTYRVQLETPRSAAADLVPVLEAFVATIEPIPERRVEVDRALLGYWGD